MSWAIVAIGGSMVIGAAGSAYAANQNRKAINTATDKNIDANNEKNRIDWLNYMYSRGVDGNGNIVNTQLPAGMSMHVNGDTVSPSAYGRKISMVYPGDTALADTTQSSQNSWTHPDNSSQFLKGGGK